MKPPKPYSPLSHCDKCNYDYPHYNSSFTKCPRCEELKNELKANEKLRNPFRLLQRNEVKSSKIKSERAGKNLRKLTSDRSEPQKGMVTNGSEIDGQHLRERMGDKRQNSISKVSKKQARINATLTKIKAERIARLGLVCAACGYPQKFVINAHVIPKSISMEIQLDPDGLFSACPDCDKYWEHLQHPEEVKKFLNLGTLLGYLWNNNKKRYYHVTDLLKIEEKLYNQVNASR